LRVLITGSSGFIGLPLSEKLSELGCEVLALCRSLPKKSHHSISWLKADLSSPNTFKAEIRSFRPEVLIHLAWQDIPDFSFKKSLLNLNQSLDFLSFIAEIESCKKILISGSCWEYTKTQGECIDTDESMSKDYFTLAKNSLRLWVEMISKEKSISFAWFRLFYVYGPGQRQNSLIPSILNNLKDGRLPNIKTPHNANDYIFIDDVVDAFSIATNNQFESGIYNLGAGKSTTALEVCRCAEQIALDSSRFTKQIEMQSKPIVSSTNFWAEITSTQDRLKWSPKTSLTDGIKKTWDHIKSI
jgi:nucleoside-diphosphate-sugar epimerase